eukprot:scaffold16956_cov73-Attheya_sp.AAC.2
MRTLDKREGKMTHSNAVWGTDVEKEDLFDAEAGRCSRLSVTVITIFPVPAITPTNEREKEIKKMRDRDTTFKKKYLDEGLRDKNLYI